MTEAQLRTQIENEEASRRSRRTTEDRRRPRRRVLVTDAKQKLDRAVSAKRITQAQADEMLTRLKQRIRDLGNLAPAAPGRGSRDTGRASATSTAARSPRAKARRDARPGHGDVLVVPNTFLSSPP